jgi:hypothetical protein
MLKDVEFDDVIEIPDSSPSPAFTQKATVVLEEVVPFEIEFILKGRTTLLTQQTNYKLATPKLKIKDAMIVLSDDENYITRDIKSQILSERQKEIEKASCNVWNSPNKASGNNPSTSSQGKKRYCFIS